MAYTKFHEDWKKSVLIEVTHVFAKHFWIAEENI